jgi:hypothetical protein
MKPSDDACADGPPDPTDLTPVPPDPAEVPPVPPGILEPVVADAAAHAGVEPDQVVVVSCVEMTWPDGSLGCPQPGMVYPQVLVDGYRVIVRAAGQELDYRVRGPGSFRRCVPRARDVLTPIP